MKLADLSRFDWTRENIELCEAESETHWIDGNCYRRDESTGKLKYDAAATIESIERQRKRLEHLDALWFALRSRVLTPEEMDEVEMLDYRMLLYDGLSFNQCEVEKRFNEGLLQQFRIRRAAESVGAK